MDIRDYLDEATRHVGSPQRAKEIRDELYDHYLRAVEDHLTEGRSFDEARALAVEALGPPDLMQAVGAARTAPRDSLPVALAIAALLSALLSLARPMAFPLTVGLSVAALLMQPGQKMSEVRRHPTVLALALLDGLVVGTYPLWAAGAYSYWQGLATSPFIALVFVLRAGTPIYLLWHMVRRPAGAFVVAGAGSAVFALTALISLVVFWRLYPVRPSPNVDWYTSPSSAGFGHMVADPLTFVLLWYVAAFAMAAVVRVVGLGRLAAKAPPVLE